MTAVTIQPRERGRPFTAADLDSMPDDGRRYELIDGCLLVTPAPFVPHQRVVSRLVLLLGPLVPPDAELFTGPLDVRIADDTVMQPDLLVARRSDLTRKNLPAAPLLAVEVLSRSTRGFDLHTKKDRYERAGTLAYWVVDQDSGRLRAWELRDGRYEQVADVWGDAAFETEVPFPLRVVPSALV